MENLVQCVSLVSIEAGLETGYQILILSVGTIVEGGNLTLEIVVDMRKVDQRMPWNLYVRHITVPCMRSGENLLR